MTVTSFEANQTDSYRAAWSALEDVSRTLRGKVYPAGFSSSQLSQVEAALTRAWEALDDGDVQFASQEAQTAISISAGIDQDAKRYARRQAGAPAA